MADKRYILEIIIEGKNRASGALNSFSSSLTVVKNLVTSFLIYGALRRLESAFKGLGAAAFESYDRLTRATIGVENLIAVELARGEVVEKTSTAIRKLTDAEKMKIGELKQEHELLNAKLVYQQGLYDKAVEKYGDNSYQALRLAASMGEIRNETSKVNDELTKLQNLEGSVINITEALITNQMSLKDALVAAQAPARDIIGWMTRLAIVSPFSEEQIQNAFRISSAYGFQITYAQDLATEEERIAKAREDGIVTTSRLTRALLDLVAGTGLPQEYIQNIATALGQVKAKGKLAAEEIRQLVNAGIGLNVMAGAMGMTVGEFKALQEEGEILADEFLPKLVSYIETNFVGASERLLGTFGGTIGAIGKLKDVLLRDFAGPLFETIQPRLFQFFEYLGSDEVRDTVKGWGESFATWVDTMWDKWATFKLMYDYIRDYDVDLMKLDLTVLFPGELGQRLNDIRQKILDIDAVLKEWGLGGVEPVAIGAGKGIGSLIVGSLGIGFISRIFTWVSRIVGKWGVLLAIAPLVGIAWETNLMQIRDGTTNAWNDSIKPALDNLIKYIEKNFPDAYGALGVAIKSLNEIDLSPFIEETGRAFKAYTDGLLEVNKIDRADLLPETELELNINFDPEYNAQKLMEGHQAIREALGFGDVEQWAGSFVWLGGVISEAIGNIEWNDIYNLMNLKIADMFKLPPEAKLQIANNLITTGFPEWGTVINEWAAGQLAKYHGIQEENWENPTTIMGKLLYAWFAPPDRLFSIITEAFDSFWTDVGKGATAFTVWWDENIVVWFRDQFPQFQILSEGPLTTFTKAITGLIKMLGSDFTPAGAAFQLALALIGDSLYEFVDSAIRYAIDQINILIGVINTFISNWNTFIGALQLLPGMLGNMNWPTIPSIPSIPTPSQGSMGGTTTGGTGGNKPSSGSGSGGGRPGNERFGYYDYSTTYISNDTNMGNAIVAAILQQNRRERLGGLV